MAAYYQNIRMQSVQESTVQPEPIWDAASPGLLSLSLICLADVLVWLLSKKHGTGTWYSYS